MSKIGIVVHGGAWEVPDDRVEDCRSGIRRALVAGWSVLQEGASAIDACERATMALEDWPAFDAGVGAHLNRDGRVQLDAILMDGRTLDAGAIAAVERVRNPIRLARLVMETSPYIMIVGPGAEQFATEGGLDLCDPADLVIERELRLWEQSKSGTVQAGEAGSKGTVGAVAIDMYGNLASATSTGGPPAKFPGRVGDSPIIGCGCYADNASGAASATGDGEAIMKVVLAKMASDLISRGGEAQSVAETAMGRMMQRTSGKGGLILLDRDGNVGAAHTTSRMAAGYRTTDSDDLKILI